MNACGKVRFPSGSKAAAALRTIRRRGEHQTKKPCRIYHCPHCDGWHLTSEPQ